MARDRIVVAELLLGVLAGAAILYAVRAYPPETEGSLRVKLKGAPKSVEINERLADVLTRDGKTAEAITYYREAIGLAPRKLTARLSLAAVLEKMGQSHEAQKLLEANLRQVPEDGATRRALEKLEASVGAKLKVDPNDSGANEQMGEFLLMEGKTKESEDYFRKALTCDANDLAARVGLARVLVLQKDDAGAQRLLEENLKRNPKEPESNELMGVLIMKSLGAVLPEQAAEKAQTYYETALAGDPMLSAAALGLSKIYLDQGRVEEATRILVKPLAEDDRNAAMQIQYANLLAIQRRYAEAIPHYSAGVAGDPNNVEALKNWGGMLIDSGRAVTAETVIRGALEIAPKDASLHMLLGRSLRDQIAEGTVSTEEAKAEYAKSIDCDPTYAPVYVEFADAYLQGYFRDVAESAREGVAEKFLRDAVKADWKYTPAKVALAKLLINPTDLKRQNFKEAADLLGDAVSVTRGKNLGLEVQYADALARIGKFDDAMQCMDRVIEAAKQRSFTPDQMEYLGSLRQSYFIRTIPEYPGHPEFTEFAVDGMRIHDPMDDPWPFPRQPSMRTMLKPLDLSVAPEPGTLLDPKFYTGDAVKREIGP